MTRIRTTLTALGVVAGVIVLSATPADARPGEPGDRGLSSAMFAGAHATGCVPYGVFDLKACK